MINSLLVPGAGGPAGINTIKSLRLGNYDGKIIGTDSNPLSAGFFLSDVGEIVPESNQPSFIDKLLGLIKNYKIQLLMPSSGYDIFPYSRNIKKIMELNCYPVVCKNEVLKKCSDKMLTFNALSHRFGKFLPFTTIFPEKINSFPAIAKPRFGKGSKNIFKILDESTLNSIASNYEGMIFQEFLPGKEYTIDVLSDLNQKSILAVPRIRIEVKGGISTKGKVIHNPEIEELSMKIAEEIGITGPCCIQLKESSKGEPKLIEINPRLGGGTIFTTLAGANFPKMILEMVDGKKVTIPKISEITVIRYFEEIVVSD